MKGLSVYRLAVAALAVSGMAQMPVFKRYHVSAVPGLSWMADYFFTFRLHYVAAAVLLFWLTRRMVRHGAASLGAGRLALLGVLAATGTARVIQNLPTVDFGPGAARLLDRTHLAAAVALGLWALAAACHRLWTKAAPGGPDKNPASLPG